MLGSSGRPLADFISSSSVRKRVLGRLTEGSRTPTELAQIEQKHVSHVSRALSQLQERGLVEAIQSNSRERHYRATYRGMALYYAMLRAK